MKLIRSVRITDFRSLEQFQLHGLGDATALVGPNGAGKSNVLRALNLFFNNQIEPGVELNLIRDFHRPKRKKRKESAVAVLFEFPSQFKVPPALASRASSVGFKPYSALAIEKRWTFDGPTRQTTTAWRYGQNFDSLQMVPTDEVPIVERALELIRFRYIPNHIHPSEVLEQEEGSLRAELIGRLKKTKAYKENRAEQVFNEFANVAENLVKPIAQRMAEGSRGVAGVGLETPEDWSDVAWKFALSLRTPAGDSYASLVQGSGTQAYLMYLLLDFIDGSYGSTFGWRQATVWAIEEPESYLHRDLQIRLSSFLRQRAQSDRLQLMLTTHDPQFMTVGSSGYYISTADSATVPEGLSARELIERSYRAGTSSFMHPLVVGTPRPLLIVEGAYDAEYIQTAYSLRGRQIPWEIHAIESLDPTLGGSGKDHTLRYLESNRLAIASRPANAPVIVLLDWDVHHTLLAKFKRVLECHESSRAYVMPAGLANPDLDDSFKGIERYLSTAVWLDTLTTHGIEYSRPGTGDYPLQIKARDLNKAKGILRHEVKTRRTLDDLSYLVDVLDKLESGDLS